MDKNNFICSGPAQDLFCDLELYADSDSLEVKLLFCKRIILKKWVVSKEALALAWSGHTLSALSDNRCNAYIGFILFNFNRLII